MPRCAPTLEDDLLSEVEGGVVAGVEDALDAGASVDGSRKLSRTPLMEAVIEGHFRIAKLLIEKGADLEIPILDGEGRHLVFYKGMRAVHLAAMSGRLDILLLLLQAGANPNSADERGRTPLMGICRAIPAQRVAMARELLQWSANAALADKKGYTPLHFAAAADDVDTMNVLLSHAPTTLNHATSGGTTPICSAAEIGAERAVSRLLSAGARSKPEIGACPLDSAMSKGHENVVNILLDDGLEAVGGLPVIRLYLPEAVHNRRPRILQRLLNVEGEKRQRHWARFACSFSVTLLHYAAADGDPAGVSVLLSAGADETERDLMGQLPRDVVGDATNDKDAVKEAAVHRALRRAPAFRARSWTWPSGSDTDAAAAAAAATDAAPRSSGRAPRAPLSVRIFRPRERNPFVKLIGRYAQKL